MSSLSDDDLTKNIIAVAEDPTGFTADMQAGLNHPLS
jgi:hypothetical protein